MISENDGLKRTIKFSDMYINTDSIISINDYSGVRDFLLEEGRIYQDQEFSLIRVKGARNIEDIIVLGSASSIYESAQRKTERKLLHD